MTTYQHDGKTGEMGGVTVGLVPSRGHGSYPLRGPPWKEISAVTTTKNF